MRRAILPVQERFCSGNAQWKGTMKTAHVRMRNESWELSLSVARRLEAEGVIWRDYDCEQNTVDNGYPDLGPCYGVYGESESEEEERNAEILDGNCISRG